jgi:hypothetical protein
MSEEEEDQAARPGGEGPLFSDDLALDALRAGAISVPALALRLGDASASQLADAEHLLPLLAMTVAWLGGEDDPCYRRAVRKAARTWKTSWTSAAPPVLLRGGLKQRSHVSNVRTRLDRAFSGGLAQAPIEVRRLNGLTDSEFLANLHESTLLLMWAMAIIPHQDAWYELRDALLASVRQRLKGLLENRKMLIPLARVALDGSGELAAVDLKLRVWIGAYREIHIAVGRREDGAPLAFHPAFLASGLPADAAEMNRACGRQGDPFEPVWTGVVLVERAESICETWWDGEHLETAWDVPVRGELLAIERKGRAGCHPSVLAIPDNPRWCALGRSWLETRMCLERLSAAFDSSPAELLRSMIVS